jgi:uncharacterized protein (DUF1697 family)
MDKYVSLLRGINVGGHKKVPMSELKKQFEKLGFKHVKTLLASGNVVFEGEITKLDKIPNHLEKVFGFTIPVITLPFQKIEEIVNSDPFRDIKVTPKTRLYVTFLADDPKSRLKNPFTTEDGSFMIIKQTGKVLFSVLDLEKTGTIDGMNILEKEYGKNITTRNYNTIQKIAKL